MKKEDKKVIVDNIPLKVKKNNDNEKTNNNLPVLKEDKKPLTVLSNVKIIATLILLAISVLLISNIVKELDKSDAIIVDEEQEPIELNEELGAFMSDNKSLFVFEKDNVFYWYDSISNRNDNYYSGVYKYLNGKNALKEMGYSIKEFNTTFGENVKVEDVYSITVEVKTSKKNGKDTSEKDLKDNETWWLIIIKTEEGQAVCYNKTLDIRYNLNSVNI